MPDKKWDGSTERRNYVTDHDHIVRLLVMNETIVETLKIQSVALEIHEAKDDRKFENLMKNQNIGIGIVLAINAGLGIFIAIKFH